MMAKRASRILASYFHTPSAASQPLFHTVSRAGHILASPDYGIERRSYPGHDLLLCVAGAGSVRVRGKEFGVAPGQLAWIDCRQPHAHWAHPRHPWELLWLRIDGKQTRQFCEALNVKEMPVFALSDEAAVIFRRVLALLRERPLAIDAALHAAVSALMALLFESRLAGGSPGERGLPAAIQDRKLRAVVTCMRQDCRRHWRIEELASLAGLSVPHFFRLFRGATGSSPMDWLRRERMNQAKRRLSESKDSIRHIAAQLGYGDPFYFSRDFKKLVGLSPRHYRQRETAKSPAPQV